MSGLTLSLFVVLSALLLGLVSASKLVYVSKPTVSIDAFVSNLAKNFDLRGDFGPFVLVVDHADSLQNLVFRNYDSERLSYFVVERVDLDHNSNVADVKAPAFLKDFGCVTVQNKYVCAIEKSKESAFLGQVPFDFEVVAVPESPVAGPIVEGTHTYRLHANPNPNITKLIAQVNSNDLKTFVTYLTGENSTILTRQALSTGAVSAQQYLVAQFTKYGFKVTTQAFRTGFSSNVVATLEGKGNASKLVLVSCHYDSRGPQVSSTTERAPGANDNGSGTGALLQIAKIIGENKVSFNYTVVLAAFSGEEQGLYGSQYAAQQFKAQKTDIIAVLNSDMLAYRVPSESPQLAFTTGSSTPALSKALANISSTYVSGLTLGTTAACCTDHSSFYNQGYAATSFYERNGNIADPQYHKSGDLVNRVGYDIELQYPLIVKSVLAGVLTLAEIL